MSSRLTEIEALIEAEVEARVEARLSQRMGALAQSLRAMADRVDPAHEPLDVSLPVGVSGKLTLPAAGDVRAEAEAAIEEDCASGPDHAAKGAGVAAFVSAAKETKQAINTLAEKARQVPVAVQPPAPKRIDPPADGPGGNDVPEGSPDWLAPVLALLRPQKEKDIARRIAAEGGVSLQEVIYHFRPPIKETYATVILSNVRTALKRGGMSLARDAEGVYRVRAEP